ncbi:MAG: phosphotransferase enzyme family protein [Luteolibacter sp.]
MMNSPASHELAAMAADCFLIPGELKDISHFGNGLINDTFLVRYQDESNEKSYILQRINHHVFRNPQSLMQNVQRVCEHIRKRLKQENDHASRCLRLIPTREQSYHVELQSDGTTDRSFWRCFDFISGCTSHDVLETPEQAYQAARKFGQFQHWVADLGGPRLDETIPDFHNTPKRFQALLDAIQADPLGRAADCQPEIESALSRQAVAEHLLSLHAMGQIPERVTHNDTKLSNVLIDNATGEGVCVVDLDTVMPGLSLYDFGDLVRTCVSPAPEDHEDLAAIEVRAPIFQALARGFLEEMSDVLTPCEIANLAFSGRLLTYEVALRFLTDHIMGDPYFGAKRPNHNLSRARNQLQLVRCLEAKEPEMNQYIDQLSGIQINPQHRLQIPN